MQVDAVYNLMLYIINKNQSGSLSPSRFNSIINSAQRSMMTYLLGEFQQYQYGRSMARVEFGMNGVIRDRLSPFIGAPVPIVVAGSGIAPYPVDYIAFDSMYWAGSKRIKEIQQDRIDSHLNSSIDPIETNPVFTFVDTGFMVYPSDVSSPTLSYIKKPTDMVYGFTLDGNNRPVYSSGSSVQPKWKDTEMFQIIARALAQAGVNLKDGMVENYAMTIKNNGE